MGVVNTVGFCKGYDLFQFDARKWWVFRCLVENEGGGKNLIGHGRNGGGSGVLYLPKSGD